MESNIARARLLDAANVCYERFGIAYTRATDIANEAKVTRPTFYHYFKSIDDIGRAVIQRELDELWQTMQSELVGAKDMAGWMAECFVFAVWVAPTRPRHRRLFMAGALELARARMLCDRIALVELAERLNEEFCQRHGYEHQGMLSIADWFNRLVLSFWIWPGPDRSEKDRRQLGRSLFPPTMFQSAMFQSAMVSVDQLTTHDVAREQAIPDFFNERRLDEQRRWAPSD